MPFSRFAIVMYVVAAISGLVSVALSALAAHGLATLAPTGAQAVDWFKQATSFQMNHALGLIAATAIAERLEPGRARALMRASALFMAAATVLFPGALYSASFNGPIFFAPYGGVSAMVGWALFGAGALACLRREAVEPMPHIPSGE